MSVVELNITKKIPLIIRKDDEFWKEYDKKDEFLGLVNPINYTFYTNPMTTMIQCRPLSCYKNGLLLKVTDVTWKEDWATFYFLSANDGFFQLGSINESLDTLNEGAKLQLDKSNIFDYLKIVGYFFVVDDRGSRFAVESRESEFIDFLPYSNELERNRNLQKIKPPLVKGPDGNGAFDIECDVIVEDFLIRANFKVHKNGEVELIGETPIIG